MHQVGGRLSRAPAAAPWAVAEANEVRSEGDPLLVFVAAPASLRGTPWKSTMRGPPRDRTQQPSRKSRRLDRVGRNRQSAAGAAVQGDGKDRSRTGRPHRPETEVGWRR